MTPRQAEIAAAIEQYGSVSAAARALGITTQTVSVARRSVLRVLLGPVPCKACGQPLVWAERPRIASSRVWRNADTERRHVCPARERIA